jgi:hypothetical protein
MAPAKARVIIERNTREMPDVYEAKGGDHDFKAYKGGAG